ncbi:MAG: rod shape-determining protein RodA [Cyanobacteria bacterium P01_F01_bin.42]
MAQSRSPLVQPAWRRWIKPWQGIDIFLLSLCGILTLLGGLVIRSTQLRAGWTDWMQHWVTGLVGVILLLLLARLPYRRILRWHWWIYAVSNLSLLLVSIIGTEANGSQRWIGVAGFNLQPSEFAKVAVIITLAAVLHKQKAEKLRDVFRAIAVIAIPWVLVLRQPDLGTSLVFGAVSIGMLYWARAKLGWILLAVLPLVAVILGNVPIPTPISYWVYGGCLTAVGTIAALSFKHRIRAAIIAMGLNFGAGVLGKQAWNLLQDYQRDRIILFLNPEKDPLGGGYHLIQSRIAIGSGGLWGQGLNQGNQTTLQFIPEQHTDFIFSAIGEQLGLVGCLFVLGAFWLMCWRLIHIARTSRDDFGSLLCIGILAMIIFQVFVNISMTIGLAPVTGIPLPWLSYGRSALLTNFIAIGLAESVAKYRQLRRF